MLADFGGAKFFWNKRKRLGEILTTMEGVKFLTRKNF
jgi:hypothetical protein